MSASRQRFRTSSGIAASDSDSVIAVRDFPSLRARSSWRVPALLLKLLERLGFFKCGQVLALQVLDQRQFHDLGVVRLREG